MKESILTIVEHKQFGPLFIPCIATRDDHYWTDVERIATIKDVPESTLPEAWIKIADLSQSYSEHELLKRFGRPKEQLVKFTARIDKAFIDKLIRPYIERRMTDIFQIMREFRIPVYRMDRGINLWYNSAILPHPEAVEIQLFFSRNDDTILYRQKWSLSGKSFLVTGKGANVIINEPCLIEVDQNLLWFSDPIDHHKVLPFFTKDEIIIPRRVEKVWFEKFLTKTVQKFHVEAEGFDIEDLKHDPTAVLHIEQDWQGRPVARPIFFYDAVRVIPGSKSKVITRIIEKEDGPGVLKIRRNFKKEKEILDFLVKKGLQEIDTNSYVPVEYESTIGDKLPESIIGWCGRNKKELVAAGIAINQEFYRNRFYMGECRLESRNRSHYDWFELHITIRFEGFEVPFIALRKNLLTRTREFLLPDGSIFLIPSGWFSRFEDVLTFGQIHGEKIRIASHHAPLLRNGGLIDSYISEKMDQLASGHFVPIQVPEGLKATLRDYQIQGYQWLVHLRDLGVNGCLADDMGLGKTVQTIAMLCKGPARSEILSEVKTTGQPWTGTQLSLFDLAPLDRQPAPLYSSEKQPSLLVAPTTLMFNWRQEIRRFAPHLKVTFYAGSDRKSLIKSMKTYDIVLTSYGIVRRDAELLQGMKFWYIILDESQMVKNPGSKTFKALLSLQSEHRLALTGTPIENSLIDLYAQMHFLNRDMFGSLKFFKRHFLAPIMQEKDIRIQQRAKNKLQDLIAPLIMRRTKSEVAKELPRKTEQVLMCRMTPEQEQLYEEEKSKVRNFILEQIAKGDVAKSSAMILTALNKLRQLACHPSMVFPEYLAGSGKLETVARNIEVLLEENHKILVISSYVRHLRIIGSWLEHQHIPFVTLTGKTKNHQQVIDRFKRREDIRLMLMSLKKGGYGLNLTEADYVMILDPWWNPASQQQGMDRVHRIGQEKPVFVYKFITLGTVEERILQMQKEKKRIADTVVGINNPLQLLTSENLEYLLDDRPL